MSEIRIEILAKDITKSAQLISICPTVNYWY